MLYAKVNQAAREALNQAIKAAENVKWYRRLKVIDLSAKRQQVSEIAAIFDLSDNTSGTISIAIIRADLKD